MPAPRPLELAGGTVLIFNHPDEARRAAANRIAQEIHANVAAKGKAVLGLATGATPEPVYERLAELHGTGNLSFANVTTFNLDEFYPISPFDRNSFRRYMDRHLFSRVDIDTNRAHVLDGTVPEHAVGEHAAQFERWIAEAGGLDLQLLGIGRNGHIGFNEPSDLPVEGALRLPARLVDLHPITIADAARDFGDEGRVIARALTLGVAAILAARSVLVLAFGANKAEAVARSLTGPMTAAVPGSLLQAVADRVTWMVDEEAAGGLSSVS